MSSWSSHAGESANTTPVTLPAGAQQVAVLVEPDCKKEEILNAIGQAQHSVWLETYFVTDRDVLAALVQAAGNGRDVRVMVFPPAFSQQPPHDYTSVTQQLQSGNVQVQPNNAHVPFGGIKHEKFMLIDGAAQTAQTAAYIMTANFDISALGGVQPPNLKEPANREYLICDSDPQDIQALTTVFLADWQGVALSPLNAPNLLVSPINVRPVLKALIDSATSSIIIEVETLSDPDPGWGVAHASNIEQALIDAVQKRGVTVQIILPSPSGAQSIAIANQPAINNLTQQGIAIKTDCPLYMHAKMIVVDKQKAFVGSQNLTAEALDRSREVGLIIANQNVVNTLCNSFVQDWGQGVTAVQQHV